MEAPNPTALERCGKEVGVEDSKGKTDIKIIMEERVTKVILQFLKDTDIGKCSTDIPLSDEGFEWD
jgi:hypothetical protein